MSRNRDAARAAWGLALAILFAGGESSRLSADAIDEALGVETLTEAVTNAAALPEAAPVAAAAPIPSDMSDQPALAATVRSLEQALSAVREENERLKDIVRRILVAHRRERLSMHYNMGCVFRAGRQFERAEAEFLKALQIDPDDAGAHFNLGILYDEDLNLPEKARVHYRRFLELAPGDPDAGRVQEWLAVLR